MKYLAILSALIALCCLSCAENTPQAKSGAIEYTKTSDTTTLTQAQIEAVSMSNRATGMMARNLSNKDTLKAALDILGQAMVIDSTNPITHYNMARYAYKLG